MVRYSFICNQVLQLYRSLSVLQFPFQPEIAFDRIGNCRLMTYFTFAKLNRCSPEEVMFLCESKSGCTHYDQRKNRYLVLYNSSFANNNVEGRIRWTLAHEFGHVVLGHLPYAGSLFFAENELERMIHPDLEKEADYFAATLLCPMPLFDTLRIKSPLDISLVFGLSNKAANVRWEEYDRWHRTHRKTAFENDLMQLYQFRESQGALRISKWRDSPVMRGKWALDIWQDQFDVIS